MDKNAIISFKQDVLGKVTQMITNNNETGITLAIPDKHIGGVRSYLAYHIKKSLIRCERVGEGETAGWGVYKFAMRETSTERQKLFAKLKHYKEPFLTEVKTLPQTVVAYIVQYNAEHKTEFSATSSGALWYINRDWDMEAVMDVYRAMQQKDPEAVRESLQRLSDYVETCFLPQN